METYTLRAATLEDIPLLVDSRVRMYREMRWTDEGLLGVLARNYADYLQDALAARDCSGWIAEEIGEDGSVAFAGSILLVWQRVPPSPRNLEGRQAYALGLFVPPEHRRRGVARALMERTIQCATDHGAPLITLHTSDTGRILYEQLGFTPELELRLFTEHATQDAWGRDEDAD